MINVTLEGLRKQIAESTLRRCSRCHEPDVELIEIAGERFCPCCIHDLYGGSVHLDLSEDAGAFEPRGAMDPFDPEVP